MQELLAENAAANLTNYFAAMVRSWRPQTGTSRGSRKWWGLQVSLNSSLISPTPDGAGDSAASISTDRATPLPAYPKPAPKPALQLLHFQLWEADRRDRLLEQPIGREKV